MTAPAPARVALVTNRVPDYRRQPFRLLDRAEGIEVVAYEELGQRRALRLLAAHDHRAVIAGLGGRVALPGAYRAARRAGVPFVLWASLWSHPTTLVHRLSRRPLRRIYRDADAIVTYGPHVSAYVAEQRGSDTGVFVAPQCVDNEHFGQPVTREARAEARARAGAARTDFMLLYVGRLEHEKGIETLTAAWHRAGLDDATLALAGEGPLKGRAGASAPNVNALGRIARADLPALYAAADALVLPSIRTATFTEPWGLVVNEAMLQYTPVIASDAVGAAAGGLVRDGRNGLVVPQGDEAALAGAIRTLAAELDVRQSLGAQAREDVQAYTPQAWAEGMRAALRSVGASREGRR
jgi:glycosyltransferase involved in cell wall biosynthesis